MVVSNTSWVRPAQAIIRLESGEFKLFPSGNRRNLPRALTFHDQPASHDGRNNIEPGGQERIFSSMYNDPSLSYFLSENSHNSQYDIEEPPPEYQVFEDGYGQFLVNENILNNEAAATSTPTEQYAKILTHKMSSQQQEFDAEESQSDNEASCMSPLLQLNSDRQLSLYELVDLYSHKMETSRRANSKLSNSGCDSICEINEKDDSFEEESCCPEEKAFDSKLVDCDSREEIYNSYSRLDSCRLQLVPLDIQLLWEHLGALIDREKDGNYDEDCCCISAEKLECLLISCCKGVIEYAKMD